MASTVDCPILIVGAGIAGLTLAQVLRSNAVPFRLIERKESAEAGGAGWGFTINWSLASLLDMLGPELGSRFDETFVDREAVARGEDATFPFFDVLTGEMKYEVPRNQKRVRVNRDKLRKLLLTDVAVEWSKSLESIDVSNDSDVVTVHLEDGSKITSHLVVGCDGTHSRVRRSLFPDGWTNKPIPANMFGMTVRFTEKELVEIRKLDSFFLHGTDRENGTYFWFSCELPHAIQNLVESLSPKQYLTYPQTMSLGKSPTAPAKFSCLGQPLSSYPKRMQNDMLSSNRCPRRGRAHSARSCAQYPSSLKSKGSPLTTGYISTAAELKWESVPAGSS